MLRCYRIGVPNMLTPWVREDWKNSGWFEHVRLGTNYRMTGFQAALLGVQLRRLQRHAEIRGENVAYFRERLRRFPGLKLADDDPRVSGHPHNVVTLRYDAEACSGVARDLAIQALEAEGIPMKPTYPYPLYRNPLFRKDGNLLARYQGWSAPQDYENLACPEAERVCRDGVWLGRPVFLGDREDMDDILLAIEKFHQHASSLLQVKGAVRELE